MSLSPLVSDSNSYWLCLEVPAGHLFRITTPEGPQVGDFRIRNCRAHAKECGYPCTCQLQWAHLSTYD
ncbi:DUF1989 domain-containing protein [Enterobacter hormaechei]